MLLVTLVQVLSSCSQSEDIHRDKPNVILIMTDDQGYGDLACHGNPIIRTPNLDDLHAESVRFTRFSCQSILFPHPGSINDREDV